MKDEYGSRSIEKEISSGIIPVAANNFDSDTFCFPTEEQPDVTQVVFFDAERRSIQFSTLQR